MTIYSAKISDRHTLYCAMVVPTTASQEHLPWKDCVPGDWVSWVLDEHKKFVPNGWTVVGYGDPPPDWRRAYDTAVSAIRYVDTSKQIIAFESIGWETSQ